MNKNRPKLLFPTSYNSFKRQNQRYKTPVKKSEPKNFVSVFTLVITLIGILLCSISAIANSNLSIFFGGSVWVLILGALLYFYLIPSYLAFLRKAEIAPIIFIVNLLFGWTLIVWVGLLIWAWETRAES